MRHVRMFFRRWLRRFGLMRPSTKFVGRYVDTGALITVIHDNRMCEVNLGQRLYAGSRIELEVWEIL